jgi:serine/threonine-protein kinase
VAVKLVPHGFGAEPLAERLKREADLLTRLSSRHIARIVAHGEEEREGVWLAMELVEGVPLAPAALGRALLPHEVLRVARGLLEGLASAHALGIVHGDVKPANVLVPLGTQTLDMPKLIDFGLGRVTARSSIAQDLGDAAPSEGVAIGTARWMAPEVLRGAPVDARSDMYGLGLVLFELLGVGELFAAADARARLRARLDGDPELILRVPPPLSDVLARMLARDPADRYSHAGEAHGAVVDLDTAPVSLEDPEVASMRGSFPPAASERRSVAPPNVPVTAPPPSAPPTAMPPSIRPPSAPRPRTAPSVPPLPRLTVLPTDPIEGLRETLRHLDLPMLDALARREKGGIAGRIARSVSLVMRLELDAAALVLEPLALQSPVARAIGATVLSPRARRVTRARVDSDREDTWIEEISLDLGALLASLGSAIGAREDGARDVARATRLLERFEREPRADAHLRTTLRIALAAARVRSGKLESSAGLDLVAPLTTAEARTGHRLDRVVRALAVASMAVRVDDLRAREELERAAAIAAETGTTLLDACAATALGALLAASPTRVDEGLATLERASTLLAHGDAPSLEHEAEHQIAAALVVQGRSLEAIPHLQRAREAAHAEHASDAEILSASFEVVAHLARGDRLLAHEATLVLGDARIVAAPSHTAALAWVARSLNALSAGDVDGAEDALTEGEARVREAAAGAEGADVYVLVEVLGMVFDAARGALPDIHGAASDLERFAQERGFTAFHWFEVLRAVLARVDDTAAREKMQDALGRVAILLGPASRLARERRTSAPPPVRAHEGQV